VSDLNAATAALLANPYDLPRRERVANLLATEAPNPRAAARDLIRQQSESVGPRLVFAELCQREGDRARAQFIRDLIFNAKFGGLVVEVDLPPPEGDGSYLFRPGSQSSGIAALRPGGSCVLTQEISADHERVAATFEAIPATFTGERNGALRFVRSDEPALVQFAERVVRTTRFIFADSLGLRGKLGILFTDPLIRFGLLEGFTCTWEAWRDHADKLLAEHPIRFVRLSSSPTPADIVSLATKHSEIVADGLDGLQGLAAHLAKAFAAEWPGVELRFLA
jgi:hypothetical protein